jgi:N-acetyl-anhydromuramyl-L-alanine amidase AmpD
MNIKQFLKFGLSQYFPTAHTKKWICLHHTCGYDSDGAISWWQKTKDKVGTAYVIDTDGTVTQVFNDSFFAYQYGLKTNDRLEREQGSIGIELVNIGALAALRGKYADMYGKEYKGQVFDNQKPWRGFRYWATYSDAQYTTLSNLLLHIADKHDLKLTINESIEFDYSVFEKYTVINHANVRRDKTDLSPAFDFSKLKNAINALRTSI